MNCWVSLIRWFNVFLTRMISSFLLKRNPDLSLSSEVLNMRIVIAWSPSVSVARFRRKKPLRYSSKVDGFDWHHVGIAPFWSGSVRQASRERDLLWALLSRRASSWRSMLEFLFSKSVQRNVTSAIWKHGGSCSESIPYQQGYASIR